MILNRKKAFDINVLLLGLFAAYLILSTLFIRELNLYNYAFNISKH